MKFYTNAFIYRNQICYCGYEDGFRVRRKIGYEPYLFLPSDKPTGYKTLDGQDVSKKYFDSPKDAREFVKRYEEVDNFKFYGLTNYVYAWINDYFEGEVKFDPKLIRIANIDIEVASDEGFPDVRQANKPITAITVSQKGKKVVFGCYVFKTDDPDVTYILCKDETDLLRKFLQLWSDERWTPDIITGWNVEFFDIPYIYNRIRVILGEDQSKRLSPWGIVDEQEVEFAMRSQVQVLYDIKGITTLDYMALYKKFSFTNQESYRLDHIASIELGEKKLDYSEYDSLIDLYKKNFQLFMEYNIKDVDLVDKLERKLGFIQQVLALAYDAKVNYSDTLATVRPWDVIIHNYLLNKNIVVPQSRHKSSNYSIVGGYVKEPQLGMHDWVVSFDLNSLYPHLIMQYNISPETFVKKVAMPSIDEMVEGRVDPIQDPELSHTAFGALFRKDVHGFLPELMQKMYNDRDMYKKKMKEAKQEYEKTKNPELQNDIARYHNMQLAKKIQLNSAYGALGNQYFRWFDNDLAESITSSGQLTIRWIERKMNEFMNKLLKTDGADYVIASDTDSIYMNMGPLVKQVKPDASPEEVTEFLHKLSKKTIFDYMNKSYEELAEYMNAYEQKMQMKREAIANKGIWTAKKRYILNVYDMEEVRYSEPKLKIQGIEAVRSSTPAPVKTSIREALSIIMNRSEPELIKYIEDFRNMFTKMPAEDIAFPRGMNNMSKYTDKSSIYKSGTPIQVRGGLMHNHLLVKHGLTGKIEPIRDGDKIKFILLKKPNPTHENVIAFINTLPKAFGLEQFIDHDTQFEKAFLDPIRSIVDVIGWKTENRSTLESFF